MFPKLSSILLDICAFEAMSEFPKTRASKTKRTTRKPKLCFRRIHRPSGWNHLLSVHSIHFIIYAFAKKQKHIVRYSKQTFHPIVPFVVLPVLSNFLSVEWCYSCRLFGINSTLQGWNHAQLKFFVVFYPQKIEVFGGKEKSRRKKTRSAEKLGN